MCYSTTSSFGTFLFVLGICIFLWIKGNRIQKALSIILFTISLMQVIEGLLWLNIKCNHINQALSIFIPILLFLHPLIIIGTVYYFKVGLLPNIIYKYILFLWAFMLPFFLYWIKNVIGKCTTIGKKGHLVWPELSIQPTFVQAIYGIILAIGIVTLNTKWYGFFYVGVASISYYISRTIYGHSWGSIWCHFVNILAVGALFINI